MQHKRPIPHSDLEKLFLDQIEKDTPQKVKEAQLLDFTNPKAFSFTLTKEQLADFDSNGPGLGILSWFENYRKEAMASTAGIRGLQNPLYPWDTRYPLNFIGIMLATMGKILVAKDTGSQIIKLAACEVRYNSVEFVELITRLQAASGIRTDITKDYEVITIFMASFIIFMYDLYGGEYVTSSHAMCRKTATKDLNAQGSQYIPSESLLFLNKVKLILDEIQNKGSYTFNFSSTTDLNIDREFLALINNGIDLYVKYLRRGVATWENLEYINNMGKKVVIECMGGSIYKTLFPIITQLGVKEKFDFLHSEENSFNYGIGKVISETGKFFDWGCDTTIMQTDAVTHEIKVPVLASVGYPDLLKIYPVGTVLLITDPDADRLVTAYIDQAENIKHISDRGMVYIPLDSDRILVMFTPNQSFLMTMDFQKQVLEKAGLWDKYNWFILKTTASQRSWDEWAKANNIPVVSTPVGFKELADAMQNIEKKLKNNSGQNILIKDVYGNTINLGKKPRLLFAGEESGGEIFGPPELITSLKGRQAISMREKSAGEAIMITSAMVGWLERQNVTLTDYLWQIFDKNHITNRFEIRLDQKYYNESEPDIKTLLQDKEKGMVTKELNNSFFLSLALGFKDKLITLPQIREILSETFTDLIFSDLKDIKFVGDGVYLLFSEKCVEVRPSGTDAMNKAYSYGPDQWECISYARAFSVYSGIRTLLHLKYIPNAFYNRIKDYSFEIYSDYKQNQ
jgi:phosphomannomutase